MAQRYIMALDYADQNAKRILQKHAKKRPLGEIESKHRYTPPQPVLSCRTVDIDVSGTRTYRPRSTTDILEEQHRLIHNIYTKRRNITSAPPRAVRTPAATRNNEDNIQIYQRLNIQVHGRPLTSHPRVTSDGSASPRPTVRRRPNSTGNIKKVNKKNYMVLRVDPDLAETSRSNKELTRVIHEQWLPERHDLNQGKFQRGQSKGDIPAGQDTWLTFGGAQTEESSGIIDAFAKFKENADFYTIEGNVGSCVAQRLQKGDKIRIGINGRLQSENLKVKKWIKEKKDKQSVEEKADKENMEKGVIPLCWEDEIQGIKSKIISPRSPKGDIPKASLCETHPVLFKDDEEEDSNQRPKIMSKPEGFKVKHRPKSGASLDGQEKENKIVVITIDKKSEEEETELNGISVDDVLKSSISAKNSKHLEDIGIEDNDDVKDKEDSDEAEMPADQDMHIDNLRSASKISMAESQLSVTSDQSRTPKYKSATPNFSRQSTAELSVGPVSGTTARIDSAKSNKSGSEKSASSSRVGSERNSRQSKKHGQPKPVFRSVTMAPFSPVYGTEGETEYIQIAQQLKSPKPHNRQDMYITQSVSDEAIRQVGRKNKIGSADSRKRAPPTTPVIPVETPREVINDDIPEDITADSPLPSTPVKPSTPTVSISIPTAESFPERDSAPESPWPSHRATLDSDEVLSKQQKRELSMRDSQIDHLTTLLGDAIIASEQISEKESSMPVTEKTVTFKEGS